MIDTMVFVADIPAATYNEGDAIAFKQIAGPSVVRQGLGQPILKAICTGALYYGTNAKPIVRYCVKNSNWNDPIYNSPSTLGDVTGLSRGSTGYQTGNDCPLQVNSAFECSATWIQTITTTVANSLYVSIDIEYPDIGGVQNPAGETGTPASILYEFPSITVNDYGTTETATWIDTSFDSFKAGYRYLMQKMSLETNLGTVYGFIKIAGGASMGGLARIIPIGSVSGSIAKEIEYAAPEVKGPFTMSVMLFCNGGSTSNITVVVDYVKRD